MTKQMNDTTEKEEVETVDSKSVEVNKINGVSTNPEWQHLALVGRPDKSQYRPERKPYVRERYY